MSQASFASLAGTRATSVDLTMPAWGRWSAQVELDGDVTLASGARVDLVIADLTLKGTILSGGPSKGLSMYRVVAGAGMWGKTVPGKAYSNDAGVKLATVLGDAAREVGETIESIASTERIGPSFVRPEGPACRLLEQLKPSSWYIDEAGVTRLGRRPAKPLTSKVTIQSIDPAQLIVRIASDTIAEIVPGVVVEGIEAVDVEHEVTPNGIRTTVWGKRGASGTSRRLSALRSIVEQFDPNRDFRGVWEYRVVELQGSRVALQPVHRAKGMPDLDRVPVRPGVAGCKATLTLGSRVLVSFINADPSRPFVLSFEDAEGNGFAPTSLSIETDDLRLAGGSQPVALAPPVTEQLQALKDAIDAASVVDASSFKSTLMAALAAWPGSIAAGRVKAS
jgi:hypothetical protein